MIAQQRFQPLAPLPLRLRAAIDAVGLQQVIGDEGHRGVGEHTLVQRLAPDALLQQRERREARVRFPHHQLAVEHRAVGQRLRQRLDLGEAPFHQLLAARPDPHAPRAPDELRADAVVLPFDEPVRGRAEPGLEVVQRQIDRMRQEEGIGLAFVACGQRRR